jgi:single-strand DNA-binding protein
VDIVAWDKANYKLAETCNTYLKKGMSVLVEGRLVIRPYDDKEGNKRKATEIVIDTMQMLDKAPGGNGAAAPPAETQGRTYSNAGFDEDAALEEDEVPF